LDRGINKINDSKWILKKEVAIQSRNIMNFARKMFHQALAKKQLEENLV